MKISRGISSTMAVYDFPVEHEINMFSYHLDQLFLKMKKNNSEVHSKYPIANNIFSRSNYISHFGPIDYFKQNKDTSLRTMSKMTTQYNVNKSNAEICH